MRILLLTPPMTQLNTPYPATAYLKGFLNTVNIAADQADPALELALRIFSPEFFSRAFDLTPHHPITQYGSRYLATLPAVIQFLQGKDPTLAMRIVGRQFLPEGPRFQKIEQFQALDPDGPPLHWAFGSMGVQDHAKFLASLYLDDLADFIKESIDPQFEFSRYGEKLASSQSSFEPLLKSLNQSNTLVDQELDALTLELFVKHRPQVIGLSTPFPGNVYAAFRMARVFKKIAEEQNSSLHIILGGGYVNTELRSLKDARVFDFFDFITFDDGERPLLSILEHLAEISKPARLVRTMIKNNKGEVELQNDLSLPDFSQSEVGTPDYTGLDLDRYLSVVEMLNPMHRIWSDGQWNKLTLAHGCYWKKCNFCDVSLDYIKRYDPTQVQDLVQKIRTLISATGHSGFHFVDEAAPPALLKNLAQDLITQNVQISWWGNIRFEKAFSDSTAQLLAQSGCIAVTGGLEVASNRLLKLMNKGVTVEQVARVTHNLSQAGILVHAYLMFGFPTQTVQETVDALEMVRQLFLHQCIHSAFWHRFSATIHSPIGQQPELYGIQLLDRAPVTFAENDLPFVDPTGVDHDALGIGLKKALYNFMLGIGLEEDVRAWFDFKVPRATIPHDLIQKAIRG
jgi:radical SAM superfamily enzyme YgiQ (UPF0313 family)